MKENELEFSDWPMFDLLMTNEELPVYTLDVTCQENASVETDHGFTWIVLCAPAWRRLPPGRLRNLLHYISTGEAGDDRFATKLAAAVRAANSNEAWRKEKMALLTFEEFGL